MRAGPPGPPGHLLVGNLPEFARDLLGFFEDCARRYGDVDDESTAELMKRFYRAMLKEGKRPAAALRAAQLELSRQPRWAAPFYWAGFVLQGDWR